ncbi:MAG: ankyrin repeat domain-containing protein [Planctomycetota bacterium]
MDVFDYINENDAVGLRALIQRQPVAAAARSPVGLSPVMFALYHRKPDLARVIVDTGYETDPFEAAALGDARRFEELLDPEPTLVDARSVDGFTPLHLACFFDRIQVVRLLLERDADPNVAAENLSEVHPIHSAVAARSVEIVKLLLEHGADPNARQHGGWTPLHAAAMHGHQELARLLLAHQADRSAFSDDGKDAATLAEEGGHPELARLLRSESQRGG